MNQNLTAKTFLNNILSGTATGIIIGLVPNAILAAIVKLFDNPFAEVLGQMALIFQLTTPLLIGILIAQQFKLPPMPMVVVGASAFVGSGVVKFNQKTQAFIGSGAGDIINTMLTAAITVGLILLLHKRLGSLSIVLTPLLIGVGSGTIGFYLYPYTTGITKAIGHGINFFSELQPILMCVLIACAFATLIISPISTIAIGMAIQLNGISAGAAAMGVAATTIVLILNSWKVNRSGVTLAITMGAIKMMMPNLFRKPIILIPCLITATISALPVALLNITGTPESAGFGLIGLVGPLAALEGGLNPLLLLICWILIPSAVAISLQFLLEKVLRLYNRKEVFELLD
ncbi:PTS sugar transporter subunit IIC [Lactobacillus halodurans]|uniref:PTS sugar transporter subunit IIC n=1 Tax=Companilactobacillus halodurans TaxID=2584183 RepID=A0A5P0ZNC2_9LACO|nr:PTS sugar transporter subunit IIC [Companilactobacillus halodurans]MQS75715.1 PTS sugar transporter subunit IIC [Companilactobacillus halodurans]MQS97637.1 PTS sugar transporter subunit IIC [Companilactobacillus halodurans]